MAIDFPNSPATNDTFTSGGRTWLYNGSAWTLLTLTQNVVTANSITSSAIVNDTIVNADINSAAAIALSKLASGTAGQIIVANSSGVPTYVQESGDITIDSSGITSITANTIIDADINTAAAIATTKITGWENDQVVLTQQVFS
jgi:2-keto-4-pentenoate hydratase